MCVASFGKCRSLSHLIGPLAFHLRTQDQGHHPQGPNVTRFTSVTSCAVTQGCYFAPEPSEEEDGVCVSVDGWGSWDVLLNLLLNHPGKRVGVVMVLSKAFVVVGGGRLLRDSLMAPVLRLFQRVSNASGCSLLCHWTIGVKAHPKMYLKHPKMPLPIKIMTMTCPFYVPYYCVETDRLQH